MERFKSFFKKKDKPDPMKTAGDYVQSRTPTKLKDKRPERIKLEPHERTPLPKHLRRMSAEDMSGMSVGSGHKRPVDKGAGMTKKGVAAYRRRNPGSKLQTAVTTPPSKLKPDSKAAKRRKAFCSRSRSWTSERGKAARRRWNC